MSSDWRTAKQYECPDCGHLRGIGLWPACPHGTPRGMQTFAPYWDEHVAPEPVWVTSLAQRKKLMRQNKMDYRDKMRPGDLSARQDKAHEMKRELARR